MVYGHPLMGTPIMYSPMTQQVTYPTLQTQMAMAQSIPQQYTNTMNALGLTSSNYEEVRHQFSISFSYLHNFIALENLEWTPISFISKLMFLSVSFIPQKISLHWSLEIRADSNFMAALKFATLLSTLSGGALSEWKWESKIRSDSPYFPNYHKFWIRL